MTMTGTLFSILVGASWLAALTHLLAAIRRSYNLTHLSFAVLAFMSGAQALAYVWLHYTNDPSHYLEAARWAVATGAMACIALLWFARFYTRSENAATPALLTALYLGLLGANAYLPHGLFFDRAPELIRMRLPWNEQVTVHAFDGFHLSLIVTIALNLATLAYVYFACWRQYRRGQRYAAMTLSIGATALLLAVLSNVAISAAGFRSLYFSSFGFIALVLLMMYWLSSDESFQAVFAQASEGIFVADRRGCYVAVNDAGCELLGFSRDELRRMHVFDIVDAQDLDEILAQRPVLLSGAVLRGTWRFRRKDGSVFTGELSSRLLPDNRILGLLRDVTAQQESLRELEERVALRTAEYAELNRQLEAFAYSVSHDLRAPVRAISAFSNVLMQEHSQSLDSEAKRHLERIVAATGHMNELIEGLLQLAKVSHQALRTETVDLHSLVEDVVRGLREREPHREVQFIYRCLPSVSGDRRLLSVAFVNLIENAWKYTGRRAHACVEIGHLARDEEQVFYVKDNGVGFDMQFAEHLFEPFRRLHSTQEFPGTGVGLATVARVIERHGGRIWAEAAEERGATFYFTLARRSDGSAPGHAVPRAVSGAAC